MNNEKMSCWSDDAGKLVLRASLALLLLFHGISKIVHGVGFISGLVESHGLPGFIAYLAYVGEVVAPVLVLLGLWTRWAAIVIVIHMAVAVLLVHTSQFFTLSPQGGWALELQGLYFLTAVSVALLGAGAYSVEGRRKK